MEQLIKTICNTVRFFFLPVFHLSPFYILSLFQQGIFSNHVYYQNSIKFFFNACIPFHISYKPNPSKCNMGDHIFPQLLLVIQYLSLLDKQSK